MFQRVLIKGVNQNRIYKLALKNGILLKNIEKKDFKSVFFDVETRKTKLLIAICEKNNYTIRVVQKYGIHKYLQIAKSNLGIIIGCLVMLISTMFASQFIWQVKVYGAEGDTLAEIKSVLKDQQIGQCLVKSKLRLKECENQILIKVKGISQASVVVKGTTVIVNVKKAILKEDALEN